MGFLVWFVDLMMRWGRGRVRMGKRDLKERIGWMRGLRGMWLRGWVRRGGYCCSCVWGRTDVGWEDVNGWVFGNRMLEGF